MIQRSETSKQRSQSKVSQKPTILTKKGTDINICEYLISGNQYIWQSNLVPTHLIIAGKWSLTGVDSHVCFQSARLVKLFATASPLASQFLLFVVAAHVRCQGVWSEVRLAATIHATSKDKMK